MRVNLTRFFGVTLLFMLPHFFMQGCSTTQQEDELLGQEGYDQEGYDSEYADEEGYSDEGYGEESYGYADEGYEEEDSYGYGNEEGYANLESSEDYMNYAGYGEDTNGLADANLGNQILDGEQTKSDLENIIAGQNADAMDEIPADFANAGTTDTGYDAGAYDTSAVPAPVNTASAVGTMPATPGVSAGPALPEMGAKMPYVVRVGDTLSSVAMRIYGSSDKWQEMVELTSLSNPDFVKPGDVVYYQLTEQTLAFASAYEGVTKELVTVQPGDTLAGIAQRVYGAAGDWKFIWRHNGEISNPDKLEVGQSLYYVSPAALSAAIDKLKTMTIADLIDQSFGKEDPKANSNLADNFETSVDYSAQPEPQLNGFQIAKNMINTFASNVGIAG